MKRRVLSLLACLSLSAFFCFGCAKGNETSTEKQAGEIEFWSTYATEKILQNRTDLYDGVKMEAAVNVDACKGEYESAQLIMTAKKAVSAYNAEITGDLAGPNGATFDKDNISLRHQKYIEVRQIFSRYNNPPVGWYPDALVPLETIVEYKENYIEEGNNQGLYITFDVPTTQAAGEYTGSLKVTYDGQEKTVPVTLTVYDLEVSQQTRSLSYFNLGFSMHLGELDSTQSMWRKYAEALIEYRIAPSVLMRNANTSEESMNAYVEEVADLVVNYGLSTINSPWKTGNDLARFLVKLAQKSIEIDRNLLSIVIVKGTDEPSVSTLPTVKNETAQFNAGITSAVSQIGGLEGSSEFIDELKASAQAIPYIIALQYNRNDATNEAGIDTYCPLYDKYDTAESRALYDDQWKGRWWYGCISPRPPYPTYHTEDTLVSARSVGWMMSEYDVVGNLYWAATVYARYDGTAYQPIEDYYSGSAERFHNCNGDGYLFYPGAAYGIDGPLASMRLEAIRDGNEEYELLYDLKEKYEDAGLSFANIQRNISDLIYSGTKVRYGNISAQFAAARKAMIQLSLMANSPAGVFITDVRDDNKGTVTYNITANSGYTLKNNGEALTGTVNGDRTDYVLTIALENAQNAIALSVEADGTEYAFDFNLGSRAVYYGAEELLNGQNTFSDGNAAVSAEIADGKVAVTVGAVTGQHQNVKYTSSVLGSITTATKRMVMYIENAEDTAIKFRMLVRFENSSLNTEIYSGTLEPGANELEINMASVNVAAGGKISYAYFYFSDEPGDYAEKTVCLSGITIYDV